jgi:hypothetical protein
VNITDDRWPDFCNYFVFYDLYGRKSTLGLHYFLKNFIHHCFICCPSGVLEDAWIEPRTVATLALTVRRSTQLDIILKLDLIHKDVNKPSARLFENPACDNCLVLLLSEEGGGGGALSLLPCTYHTISIF